MALVGMIKAVLFLDLKFLCKCLSKVSLFTFPTDRKRVGRREMRRRKVITLKTVTKY